MKNKAVLLNIVLAIVVVVLVFQLSNSNNHGPEGHFHGDRHEHHEGDRFQNKSPRKDEKSVANKTDDNGTISNATLTTIFNRKSVRHYTNQTVSKDQLNMLMRAGMASPTAMNKQPWVFVAVDSREELDKLAEALPRAKMLKQATAAIAVCGDLSKALTGAGQEYWIQDCSAATENILLAAESIGLGAVWTGVYPNSEKENSVREFFELPEDVIPLNVIAVGYPTGEDKPKDKWDETNIHWKKW